jgi:hypothetical protein
VRRSFRLIWFQRISNQGASGVSPLNLNPGDGGDTQLPLLLSGNNEQNVQAPVNPKGIPAQSTYKGCEERATLGQAVIKSINPNGVAPHSHTWRTANPTQPRGPGQRWALGRGPFWGRLEFGHFNRNDAFWMDQQDALLGTMPDQRLAKKLGRSVDAVRARPHVERIRLRKGWRPEDEKILGSTPRSTATSKSLPPLTTWPPSPSTSRTKAPRWSGTMGCKATTCAGCAS